MTEKKNRSARARELAGLTLGQAARLLDTTIPADLLRVEASPEVPPDWISRLSELYRVSPEWLTGSVPQYDYTAVDGVRGAENITAHDRDVVAEFAALLRRDPVSPETQALRDQIQGRNRDQGIADVVLRGDPPTVDLIAFDRQLALLEQDATTGRFGATTAMVDKWRAYRKVHWP